MTVKRSQIVTEARQWIGTPYHRQASLKGVGCDCLGLVRGIWRATIGAEPLPVPAYSDQWDEIAGKEELLAACRACMDELTGELVALPGDVVLYRMKAGFVAKHCAIQASSETFIHSYRNRAVVEVHTGPYWLDRIAAIFAFPGVE